MIVILFSVCLSSNYTSFSTKLATEKRREEKRREEKRREEKRREEDRRVKENVPDTQG